MKQTWKKRIVALSLGISMLFPALAGCGAAPEAPEKKALWIVTEQTTWDRMNGQLSVVKEQFEKENLDVTVRVDYLPVDQQERAVYLQQLRTQILQGGGPDGYLLPTDNNLILDEPAQYTYVEVDPLFVDVELAMRNGLFYDISRFYDEDEALGKEGLCRQVMDAGVVDGGRYVLPLRYDIPVIYAQNEALEEAGLDPSVLTQDILRVMEAVLQTGDPVLAGGILHESFSAFSDLIDYSGGNAKLEQAVLMQYLQTYQALQARMGNEVIDLNRVESEEQFNRVMAQDIRRITRLNLANYIRCAYEEPEPLPELPDNVIIIGDGSPFDEQPQRSQLHYYPLYIGTMADALEYAPVAKYEESQLTMVPMRSVGGDVVATVTYYAAVGSGCEDPALAYQFLRQFLLEESQWEANRPERNHTKPFKQTAPNTSNDLQYPGLIENGWPVRSENSGEALWQIRRRQIYIKNMGFGTNEEALRRMRRIGLGELESERLPILEAQIDQVRFNVTLSQDLEAALAQLNDLDQANQPTDVDLKLLAQQLIWNLRWHVSEG